MRGGIRGNSANRGLGLLVGGWAPQLPPLPGRFLGYHIGFEQQVPLGIRGREDGRGLFSPAPRMNFPWGFVPGGCHPVTPGLPSGSRDSPVFLISKGLSFLGPYPKVLRGGPTRSYFELPQCPYGVPFPRWVCGYGLDQEVAVVLPVLQPSSG